MPYVNAWMHFVWATKKRKPLLHASMRQQLYTHIRENAKEKGIYLNEVNGYIEHIHLLASLSVDQTIAKTIQLIKGESSYWVNKNNMCAEKLEWQDGYFAIAVCESSFEVVRNYIRNQEIHHAKKTYQQEYEQFIRKYDFKKLG